MITRDPRGTIKIPKLFGVKPRDVEAAWRDDEGMLFVRVRSTGVVYSYHGVPEDAEGGNLVPQGQP